MLRLATTVKTPSHKQKHNHAAQLRSGELQISAVMEDSGGRYKWIFKSVCPGPGRGITPTRGQQLILFTKRLSAICRNGLCLRCGSDLLHVVEVLKSHAGDLAAQSRKVFQSLSAFKSQRSKPADERIS